MSAPAAPRETRSLRASAARSIALAALAALTGCALTGKAEPLAPRFYNPDVPAVAARARPSSASLALHLGRVKGGEDLKERMVYRESDYEVGFYDERRWAERPEVYVRRAVERSLFEDRGFARVVSGPAPTLDVEVVAFEEVRGPRPAARVRLTAVLHDEQAVFLERTLTVEKPMHADSSPPSADAFVRAMGEALREAVGQVVESVVASMPTAAPPAATARGG